MTEDPGEDPMPNLFGPAEALPWMDLHGPAIPIVSARRLLQAATRKRLRISSGQISKWVVAYISPWGKSLHHGIGEENR